MRRCGGRRWESVASWLAEATSVLFGEAGALAGSADAARAREEARRRPGSPREAALAEAREARAVATRRAHHGL